VPLSPDLGGFRAEILSWGFFEPRWWRNHLHGHSFFEICYAYAGRGTFRCLGTDYTRYRGASYLGCGPRRMPVE
jgi:AraC family L-rhamnose operon transcriptional activator RhaR